MRVVLVGPLPPPSGGMANMTLQLKCLLEREGATVEIVLVNAPYRPKWMGGVRGLRAVVRLFPYLIALWKAIGRADVVHLMANSGWSWHLFAEPAIWIGRLRETPVVVNYHGGMAEEFLSRRSAWVRLSMRLAARLIVPSAFLREIFAKYGIQADVVSNVIDVERFKPGEPRGRRVPTMLVARNLEPVYDNASAIRALALVKARIPEARLVVAGSGPEELPLRQLVKDLYLGDSVRFAGRVDTKEMPALYREADISLNPSLADNMPISVLEALAAGVPVVSTRVGGVPFVVEHEKTALLVAPGAPEEMAEAVLRILTDPALAGRLSTAGVQEAKMYTWEKIRPQLFEVYEDVMGGHGSASLSKRRVGR